MTRRFPNDVSRRRFLTAGGTAAAGWLLLHRPALLAQAPASDAPICAFTKFLQDLSYEELGATIKRLGLRGIEATVRKGGHVLPERVEEDLPRMVAALKEHGVEVTIMASDVGGTDDLSQRVLRTAAGLGIRRYRMGFYRYDPDRPVPKQLAELRPQLRDLAALNRELGMQALYQNHSGAKYVGATLWDLHRLIRDIPSAEIASAFDIRHATIEAGLSWPVLFKLMLPHIGAIYVKDFDWEGNKARHVPLGTGRVDPKFFEMVRETEFVGPFSLHVEYLPKEGVEANIAALQRDLKTLQTWMRPS